MAALAVARARGGTRAYFAEAPGAGNWIVEAAGQEAATAIGRHFASGCGGLELEVPLGPSADRVRIWRQIRYRHAAGQNKAEIARALGITTRTVRSHINGHCPLVERQLV